MIKQIKVLIFSIIISLTQISFVQGEIHQIKDISDYWGHVDPKTHLNAIYLFNIAGTLYKPQMTMTDYKWREYFSERVKAVVTDSTVAEKIINEAKSHLVKIPKKLIQKTTPPHISALQEQEIPVFGITQKKLSTPYARKFDHLTSVHLNMLGIDLEETLTYCNPSVKSSDKFAFSYGMIFCVKCSTGEAVVSFLENNNYFPSQVIMFDDSQKSLESVEAELAKKGIPFIGFRYGRMDSIKEKFNPNLGIIQFDAFVNQALRIISDKEAAEIYKRCPNYNYQLLLDDLILDLAEDYIDDED